MTSMPIHIFLSGLIALAPDPAGKNQLTALLVDVRHPPADLACRAEHHPRLIVQTADADCTAAGCSLPSAQCTCNLDREEISLTILPQPLSGTKPLSKRPSRSLPFDDSFATDFGYVANLSSLGQTLKDGLLDTGK